MNEEARPSAQEGHDLIDKMDLDELYEAGLDVLVTFAQAIEDHNIEKAAELNDLMAHINRRTEEMEKPE